MKTPKQILREWVEAFNNHDVDALVDFYHEDAENLQIAVGVPLKGKEEIRTDFIEFFESNPKTSTKIENLFGEGEWAAVEWSGSGIFYKDGKTENTSGKKYALRGCGFFHIVDEKIKLQRGYWDKATWFEQIGLSIENKGKD